MEINKKEYYKESIKYISLEKEEIIEIFFEECIFEDLNILNTRFNNCSFVNCKIENSLLSAISVINCRFIDTTFNNCKAIGIDWSQVKGINGLCFIKSKIDFSNFTSLKLAKILIKECSAKEVNFSNCNLHEGVLTNTDFSRSIFNNTNLSKCDFSNSLNYCIDVRNNIVKGAVFTLPEAISLLTTVDIKIN